MPAIAMGLLWAGYAGAVWGYCVLKGYNVTLSQLVNPKAPYRWPKGGPPKIPAGQLLPGKVTAATTGAPSPGAPTGTAAPAPGTTVV